MRGNFTFLSENNTVIVVAYLLYELKKKIHSQNTPPKKHCLVNIVSNTLSAFQITIGLISPNVSQQNNRGQHFFQCP